MATYPLVLKFGPACARCNDSYRYMCMHNTTRDVHVLLAVVLPDVQMAALKRAIEGQQKAVVEARDMVQKAAVILEQARRKQE